MRISDTLVVQFVEGDPYSEGRDRVVFVDDTTGREVVKGADHDTLRGILMDAQAILDDSGPPVHAVDSLDIDGIEIPRESFISLAYALGYFARSAQ